MNKTLSINIGTENILLFGSFAFLLFYADSKINQALEGAGYEGETSSVSSTDYIQRMKNAVMADDYAVIRTLYKVKSAINDILYADFCSFGPKDEHGVLSVVDSIRPYMTRKNRDSLEGILSGIGNVRNTFSRLEDSKRKLTAVSELGKNEKLKAALNELPAITGSEKLENLSKMKDMLAMFRPVFSADRNPHKEHDDENCTDTSAENDKDLEEIMDLINILDKKK
ncbi:MAG: hypothetical protein E7218_05180 [Anaerofustis stercorihominis]|nr:hypothetical protein [Anaerofustis stercorihominis]